MGPCLRSLHKQIPLSSFYELLRERFRIRIFLIEDRKIFPAGAQREMDGTDHIVKGKHKLFPEADHFAAVSHKLLIPYIQRSDILRRKSQIPQKPVSLHQNFIVGGESRHIDTAELAQLHIKKTSPL